MVLRYVLTLVLSLPTCSNLMDPKTTEDTLAERTYADYSTDEHLNFDPLKDLNLPSSYEEVQARYKQLRAERIEALLN